MRTHLKGRCVGIAGWGHWPDMTEMGAKKTSLPCIDGKEGFFCPKCLPWYGDPDEDNKLVFCPVCEIVIHTMCIGAGFICKYKTQKKHNMWTLSVLSHAKWEIFHSFRWLVVKWGFLCVDGNSSTYILHNCFVSVLVLLINRKNKITFSAFFFWVPVLEWIELYLSDVCRTKTLSNFCLVECSNFGVFCCMLLLYVLV